MKVLGVGFETHESGAALLDGDGSILAVISEERLTRVKMDEAAPVGAARECLRLAGVRPEEIGILAVSGFPPFKRWLQYARCMYKPFVFTGGRTMGVTVFPDGSVVGGPRAFFYNAVLSTGLPQYMLIYMRRLRQVLSALPGFRGRILHVPHHDCHSATAFYAGNQDDDVLSVVVEGYDWEHSCVIETVDKGVFRRIASTPWPHSPGTFYKLITRILGFNPRRHAGKITGLAAYGNPEAERERIGKLMWADGMELRLSPLTHSLHSDYVRTKKMPPYFDGASREDLAASFQAILEDRVSTIVERAVRKTGRGNVVLAGGVAANVKMNQRIQAIPGVRSVYIHAGMGDSGQPLGAALVAVDRELRRNGGRLMPRRLDDVYLGPGYTDDEIAAELGRAGLTGERPENLERKVAELLHEGKVVCRFNGRMEYGPRALGNRSILYHTRDRSINDWLNKRLKRTEFMPFAPSTLIEYADQCYRDFEPSRYSAEFMTITYDCTDWMRETCPAVVHVDGTARPQLVTKEANPSYYRVIDEYRKISGIPSIVNTSYNMHEEPIVCTPNDAVRAFLASGLDYLAIGPFLVAGTGQPQPQADSAEKEESRTRHGWVAVDVD
ncbi:MAG TPA: carbamoyltransferase C-terminal domain-containing protein [Candidatus Saccharimonadales bacterium]|nr:carbamoyltransferase C-terminal domain-containing protein [Candidatus Saccharimonadales bacterium]